MFNILTSDRGIRSAVGNYGLAIKNCCSLLRPHHYIKNGFVFIGPLFSHQWSVSILISSLWVFVCFCLAASSVYVLNDIMDVDFDREHPVKKRRPIASGLVSIRSARSLAAILALSAFFLSLWVGCWVVACITTYFFLNIAYSIKLKHVVILDVFIISAGFMLRVLSGTLGLGIEPSEWLLLCGIMVTLFLGFSKRRAELQIIENLEDGGNLTRRVLDDYSPAMLEQFIAITAACTVITYGLYTVSPSTIELHGSDDLVYTLPFVVYGIFRYMFLLHHRAKGNDTAKDLLTDGHLLFTVFGWAVVTFSVLIFSASP